MLLLGLRYNEILQKEISVVGADLKLILEFSELSMLEIFSKQLFITELEYQRAGFT